MRNLIKIFLSVTVIIILIIFSDKVNALEVISKEIFEYTIEQTAPEDLDLSFKNGTIYSDKYLKEIEEFNERHKNQMMKIIIIIKLIKKKFIMVLLI